MKHRFITIEGNIGAGKTTLAQILAYRLNAKLILEEFAENPFLQKFYENPSQYAFPLELFFMAERFKQMKDLIKNKDLFQSVTVSDYLFSKCLLFAKVNLVEEEFKLYQKLFEIMHPQILFPEIVIYLHSPIEKLQENIKRRNRSYEQSISNQYLFKLQETYTSYIREHHVKTIFVDASNANFMNNELHVQTILNALEQDSLHQQVFVSLP